MLQILKVKTNSRSEFIDITKQVQDVISSSEFKKGICHVYITHTTAGVTINENADPNVKLDIIRTLEKTIPWKNNYSHLEGTIPIENAKLLLGIWQCIYFCEFDGPRSRNVIVNLIGN